MSLIVLIENCLHLIIFCLDATKSMFTHKKKTSKAQRKKKQTSNQLYEIFECITFLRKKKKEEKHLQRLDLIETKEQK